MRIIENATGAEKSATYATTPTGNKRMNVDGKFYTDNQFNKKFTVIKEIPMMWRSHLRQLFDEILINPGTRILHKPLQISIGIIAEAAKYAAEIKDEKMIGYFARLAIYNFSDPTNEKEYDEERTHYYIDLTKK